LAGDSFSSLSGDPFLLLPQLDTLLLRRRRSVDDAADRDLDGGPLLLLLAFLPGDGDSLLFSLTLRIGDGDSLLFSLTLRTGDGDSLLFSLTLRTGDGDSLLLSLTLRTGDGDSCRRLSGDFATGVAARGRLDEDVEDPADSLFPRANFLLAPFILIPTASGSA
jgi:hypothetical protein